MEYDLVKMLINLDQTKSFAMVNHHYMKAVLRQAGLGPVFCGRSVVHLSGYLSRTFNITCFARY